MEQKSHPVDVISLCSAEGEIRPLRLQMLDEERQLLRVNIDQILRTEDICFVGVEAKVFLCRATVWNRQWLFQLKYTLRTHCWQLVGKIP